MKQARWLPRSFVLIGLGCILVILIACGAGADNSGSSGNTAAEAVVPTMPPAQFTAVANQVVLTQTVKFTATVSAGTVSTETINAEAANAVIERGARIYTKNKCDECHGKQGEGVPDKGNALTQSDLALAAFDDLLRTGGDLGSDHIYGQSAVSPSGMEALYAYVQSLPGK